MGTGIYIYIANPVKKKLAHVKNSFDVSLKLVRTLAEVPIPFIQTMVVSGKLLMLVTKMN